MGVLRYHCLFFCLLIFRSIIRVNMPWWPSCLDRGALNNVDAPGFGTSVVRGPTGHKKEDFHPGVQLYPKVSSPKVPTSRRVHKSLNRVLIQEAILVQE